MSKPEIKVTEKMYDTLLRPVITEKAMKSSENGQVTFHIPLTATKTEVKAAVEALFGVKVKLLHQVFFCISFIFRSPNSFNNFI